MSKVDELRDSLIRDRYGQLAEHMPEIIAAVREVAREEIAEMLVRLAVVEFEHANMPSACRIVADELSASEPKPVPTCRFKVGDRVIVLNNARMVNSGLVGKHGTVREWTASVKPGDSERQVYIEELDGIRYVMESDIALATAPTAERKPVRRPVDGEWFTADKTLHRISGRERQWWSDNGWHGCLDICTGASFLPANTVPVVGEGGKIELRKLSGSGRTITLDGRELWLLDCNLYAELAPDFDHDLHKKLWQRWK